MPAIVLKTGREESLHRRHPWIFSGAVERIEGEPQSGGTVEIRSSDGAVCGRGAYSPHSQIAVRVWTFDPDEEVTPGFFRRRLERAIGARLEGVPGAGSPGGGGWGKACGRLVYAESDGLPGVIADRYAGFIVCQFLSAGAERWRETIVSLLGELSPCEGMYERSDVGVREKEGLPLRAGSLAGAAPPDLVEIEEGTHRFLVDIRRGQKTGFFLDQKENRAALARFLGPGEVLDGFSNTGSFTVVALAAGASHVTAVDSSTDALALARRNVELNGFDPSRADFEEGNLFSVLRRYRDSGRRFDAVILDPPKFADSRSHVEAASRGYKDINLQAMHLLKTGGLLVTFSCSQHISADLFQMNIAYAAVDAGREVQILRRLQQSPDHPIALNFPESGYLKGAVCRVW